VRPARAVPLLRRRLTSGCYFFPVFFFPQVFFVFVPAMLRPPAYGFQCRPALHSHRGYHIRITGPNGFL